jgi:arsenate reductase (thioredoxin)
MFRQATSEQRLQFRAPAADAKELPTVLFVCVHNAGRSRMAEAFFNDLAGGLFRGVSAGTRPADRPHPEVVQAMADAGLTVEDGPGRLLTPELAASAVRVVTMGCDVEEACPAVTMDVEDWGLPDPKGKSPAEVTEIRDQIEIRVRNLIASLMREQR